jgi:hypothetical protein
MKHLQLSESLTPLIDSIQFNCDLSDAKDSGIYSMCTLFLRLRNLYKWQHNLDPWQEAEPKDLLAWIEKKEEQWLASLDGPFKPLSHHGNIHDPFDVSAINSILQNECPQLLYGAGHGRSLKAIFFLAEIKEKRLIDKHPLYITDREVCRELSSPFAMHQDGTIFFRLLPFRYFLWDRIQEGAGSKAAALHFALSQYQLIDKAGKVDQLGLRRMYNRIVEQQMEAIIFHELGELRISPLSGSVLAAIVSAYPASPIELVARAVKDGIADTCDGGMLDHIVQSRSEASLGFFMAMLDGMRREIIPEMKDAFPLFVKERNWSVIEEARQQGFSRNTDRAVFLADIAQRLDSVKPEDLMQVIEEKLLQPLHITLPKEKKEL